ncbi:hypothetical protein [uncultured Roseovarius sp.]|mgnify:FL=1|uniref:hypothetical protein n=1 Tax=uncultured Roseovarius sp. TaxID=293344 RepID=UPI000C40D22B|nr:hypothetical protein [Roseovarius sp.]MBD12453.1 hypothetical protein [Roseovarius sp.]|tara:strand:+ start:171 stop:395 length:225 start_codon:yes stop_codon:yes gene_type:complete
MADREDLKKWVVEALKDHGGQAALIDVAKHIWKHHEVELRASGDLFYKWQYDMRWAAMVLRKQGVMSDGWALKT